MFLPIAVMIIFSFNDPQGRQNITWQGFTIQNYFDVWSRPDITGPMLNSLLIALVSTIIATILGTLIGLALTRYNSAAETPVNLLIYVPMATPEVIMGASLLALWGLSRCRARAAHDPHRPCHVLHQLRRRHDPCPHRRLQPLAGGGRHGPGRGLLDDLPQGDAAARSFPGILAAAMLSFALSIDDYVITSFVSGPDTDVPAVGLRRVAPACRPRSTSWARSSSSSLVAIIAQILWARRRAAQDRLLLGSPQNSPRLFVPDRRAARAFRLG